MSQVSCKSAEPSKPVSVSHGTGYQRQYKYKSEDNVNTVYSSPRPSLTREGKANWRQTPLIRTRYSTSSPTRSTPVSTRFSTTSPTRSTPVSLSRVSQNTVHFQTNKRTEKRTDKRTDATSVLSENSQAVANTRSVPRSVHGYNVSYGTTLQWPPIRDGVAKSDRGLGPRMPGASHAASLLGQHSVRATLSS